MERQTKVINRKYKIPFDVYIGRPSIFGNQFHIGKDGDRDEVIRKYRKLFHWKLKADAKFKAKVDALKGRTLGCWCSPAKCHGDVIVEYLEHRSSYFDDVKIIDKPPQKTEVSTNSTPRNSTEFANKESSRCESHRSLSMGIRSLSSSEGAAMPSCPSSTPRRKGPLSCRTSHAAS